MSRMDNPASPKVVLPIKRKSHKNRVPHSRNRVLILGNLVPFLESVNLIRETGYPFGEPGDDRFSDFRPFKNLELNVLDYTSV